MHSESTWWAKPQDKKYNEKMSRFSLAKRLIFSIFLMGTLVLLTFITSVSWQTSDNRAMAGPYNARSYLPSTESILQGCGQINVFTNTRFTPQRITPEAVTNILIVPQAPMGVPAFGHISTEPLDPEKRFYAVTDDLSQIDILKVVASLYEGDNIIWYDADLNDEALPALRNIAKSDPNVFVLPWTTETRSLRSLINIPMDRKYAYSTWGASQTCSSFSKTSFEEFISMARSHAIMDADVTLPIDVSQQTELVSVLP